MITIEESKRDACFCCPRTNDEVDDDGEPVNDVRDIVFISDNEEQRRMPLCVMCRSELFDELTPDDDEVANSHVVKELNW